MNELTREEALRRWNAAKATRKAMIEKMRKSLYEDYLASKCKEPFVINVL